MRYALIELLKERSGRDVTISYEADRLSKDLGISRQTIQRLTGALTHYTDGKISLRAENKEIIAKYLGYDNWAKLESFLRKIANTGPENMYRKASAASGEERIDLLLQAAEGGSADAMADLADCYLYGTDAEADKEEGLKWLHAAADAGHSNSAAELGWEYCDGDGSLVAHDPKAGEKYLTIAAKNGMTEAQDRLALLYYTQEMYADALIWARKAAIENSDTAFWLIGKCFLEGYGVKVNKAEGVKWMESAAKLGNADAQWHTALAHYEDDILPKNYPKMLAYLKKSAKQGNPMGMLMLGKCHLYGWGARHDRKLGKHLIQQAAEAGCKDAVEFIANNPKEFNKYL